MNAMEKLRQCVDNDMIKLKQIFMENRNLFDEQLINIGARKQIFNQRNHQELKGMIVDIEEKRKEYIIGMFEKFNVYKNFIRLIETHEQFLFRDFYTLGLYMESVSLNTIEKFNILVQFINANIKLLAEKNVDRIPVYQFLTISYKDAVEFYITSEEYEELQEQIENSIECEESRVIPCSTSVSLPLLQKTHDVIQKCYLSKLDTYTIEDVNQTIGSFRELGVSISFCESLRTKLNKEIQKRKQNVTMVNTNIKKEAKMANTGRKEKERIISHFYNEYTGEVVPTITEEVIYYVASLMIELGYEKNTIVRFFQDIRRSVLKKQALDCLTNYSLIHKQVEYYSKHDWELKELMEEADTILTFIQAGEQIWYSEFHNLYAQMKSRIPHNYAYELNQAQNLFKQRQKISRIENRL